ncbi:MAG: DEAD/DEAH box helicase [Armatimonadota bacterium]|nr:DEAD/DEAH box helicase [Armatimonadota bacterium]MDR7519282.1 DEAD/DEAH box helicase [Armatimonadota bacterium]
MPPGPFVPASFQRDALAALVAHDVLVMAPTGSGKTWIAQEAIRARAAGAGQTWYTTPLKALSNQKFRQFQGLFGEEAVGLLTGERRINPRAPVIVGTTEILRNVLYGGADGIGFIVLDEAHYLGDVERGTAWEEVLLLASPSTRLLLLSASLPNADELAGWLEEVRGRRPVVVREDRRPVPLRILLADAAGRLLPPVMAGRLRREERRRTWLPELLRQLEAGHLLPAILFFPSRRECDVAVRELAPLRQSGAEERARALGRWEAEYPTLLGHPFRHTLIQSGIAPHHAGHLMAWRLAVEDLLARGLIRAVAATTTLASGLDVPARTVVLSTLVRNSPEGPVALSATEFQQMSGRAGRRGRDRVGVVVVPASERGEAHLGLSLAEADPEPVTSAFAPSYTQVLNMLVRRSLEEAVVELQRSFAAYQGLLGRRPRLSRHLPEGAVAEAAHRARDGLTAAFLMRAAILQVLGYLDASARLTDDGRWAMRLRHPRLLVLAELVRRRQVPATVPRLAATAAALGTERPPRGGGTKARLAALSHVVQEIARLERTFGLEPDPVAEEFKVEWNRHRHRVMPAPAERRAEAVEAWARGAEWLRLVTAVESEEGDLQRTVLQAAEILMQLEGLPFPSLRALAREAREALLRPPVV